MCRTSHVLTRLFTFSKKKSQSFRPNVSGTVYRTNTISTFNPISNAKTGNQTPRTNSYETKYNATVFSTFKPISNTQPTFESFNQVSDKRVTASFLSPNSTTHEGILSNRTCGVIGYCDNSAYEACSNIPLNMCEQCSQVGAALFLFFAIIMGLAILIGNSIIVAVGVHRYRKGKAHKSDICKSSLAAADFLAGIQILVVTVYNYSWSNSLTSLELDREQHALRGSVQATFGATLYIFGFTSSIYHLLYMSLQRLYAILLPIHYKLQKNSSVYIGITVVWGVSIVSATVPAWFSKYFVSDYTVPGFLYLYTLQDVDPDTDYTPLIILTTGLIVVPFFLMTLTTMACGVLIKRYYVKKNRKLRDGCRSVSTVALTKQKVNAFKTVAIMQLGLTITLFPILVVSFLSYEEKLDCTTISRPYLICLYLGISNSLVNVIVYNIRDPNFRSSVRDFLSGFLPFK